MKNKPPLRVLRVQSSRGSLLTKLLLLTALLHCPNPVTSELQPVPGYPNCFVQDPTLIGNNHCENFLPYNSPACGSDGIDCAEFNTKYPKCKALETQTVGDGNCQNSAPYNTPECQFDGGDCTDFRLSYPECEVELTDFVGDGVCQDFEPYNTVQCKYDGGDCLKKKKKDYGDRYVGIGAGSIMGVVGLFVLICWCGKKRHRRLNAVQPQSVSVSRRKSVSVIGNVSGLPGSPKGLPVLKHKSYRYTLKDAKEKRELELSNHGKETATDLRPIDLSGASMVSNASGASMGGSPGLTRSAGGNNDSSEGVSDNNMVDIDLDMDIEAQGDQGQGLGQGTGIASISPARNDSERSSHSNLASISANSSSSVTDNDPESVDVGVPAGSLSPSKNDASEVSVSTNRQLEAAFLSGSSSISSASINTFDGEKEQEQEQEANESAIAKYMSEPEVEKDEEEDVEKEQEQEANEDAIAEYMSEPKAEKDEEEENKVEGEEEINVDAVDVFLDDASDASSGGPNRFRSVSIDFSV